MVAADGRDGGVVVVGAGAAGMAAALAAARRGSRTWLIESSAMAGGTVAKAFIHTLAGLYDPQGKPLNDGLIDELVVRLHKSSPQVRKRRIGKTWCLAVSPEVYRNVVRSWLDEEHNILQLYASRVTGVRAVGGRLTEVEITSGQRPRMIRPRALIDTTGSGEVVGMVDRRLVLDDDERAAGGVVFRLGGVQPGAVAFPKGLKIVQQIHLAAQRGELPSLCQHAWLDSGTEEGEVYVKLFVPLSGDWRSAERRRQIDVETCRIQEELVTYLRRFTDFAGARVTQTGELGVRDGGRIRGEYYLTEEDIRSGRRFEDGICRCSWPIEYWHPQRGLELEYLPAEVQYEIPLRSLQVKGHSNLWAAGKCLSADHRAQASARVVGSCWKMGEAAGTAAHQC
ncbi:MAG: FAD-dependent oxidoreductase [Planctomycetales bacterium]|nr:FAD-dependent oxidoreductase [Planctomycetales bacterium]